MANILHGPFVPGAATSAGSYGTGVGQSNTYTSGNANNDETQSAVALHGFNGDLLTAFVLSGVTCTKDGVNANQLDIASGEAYLIQSDGTLARCDVGADNTHITSGASVTWHLYLQPDGSWYWNTANTPAANSLFIAQVVTDASGNIAAVTDERTLIPRLFTAGEGVNLTANELDFLGGAKVTYSTALECLLFFPLESGGVVQGHLFRSWDGSTARNTLGIGGGFAGAFTWFNNVGALAQINTQPTVGSFGVPVIVAQAINTHVTTTGVHTILTYSIPATGLYRFSSTVYNGTSASQKPSILATYTGGNSAAGSGSNMTGPLGQPFDGVTSSLLNGTDFPLLPQIIYLKAGTNFVFQYTSGAAAPNDNISVILERLS